MAWAMPPLHRASRKELFNKGAFEQRLKGSKTSSRVGRRMGRARAPGWEELWVQCRNAATSLAWLVWRGPGKRHCRHRTGGDRGS